MTEKLACKKKKLRHRIFTGNLLIQKIIFENNSERLLEIPTVSCCPILLIR